MPTTVARSPDRRAAVDVVRSVVGLGLLAVCLTLAGVIVFVLRIGPVLAVIDAREGRGVHYGDLLAVPLVLMGLVVFALAWTSRAAHPR